LGAGSRDICCRTALKKIGKIDRIDKLIRAGKTYKEDKLIMKANL
jgi:hypothetical protein